MRTRKWRPSLALIVAILVVAGVLLVPWAFHIGGRWTPLLTWFGSGKLRTKGGREYPLFLFFHPSGSFSRLHPKGRSPTGGLQGEACLCVSPGVSQRLRLSGTIYDGWPTTDGAVMAFRLLEPTIVDLGHGLGGYFELIGRWKGKELVMDDGGAWSKPFRSGLRIEQASVTLRWSPYWTCKAACESAAK